MRRRPWSGLPATVCRLGSGLPARVTRCSGEDSAQTKYYNTEYVHYQSYQFSGPNLFWDEFWGNLLGERKARCDVDVWHDCLCLHTAVTTQVMCCCMRVGCQSSAHTRADSWERCRYMMSELNGESRADQEAGGSATLQSQQHARSSDELGDLKCSGEDVGL